MQLNSQDIDAICGLVHDLCGVNLDSSKGYLIESRLAELARRAGCEGYAELARKARASQEGSLKSEIIDAITTNETLFFRDNSPFEALRHKALPETIDAIAGTPFPKRIRIWSAACSTGQEPYSIAMLARELIPDVDDWDIRITATDVSNGVIRRASQGWYSSHEIDRGLSRRQLDQHFIQRDRGWQIRDEVRYMVHFQRLNLLESFTALGRFDIIFCRNVAIYFTPECRKSVYQRIAQCLNPEGYLFLGSAESIADLETNLQPERHCGAVFYRHANVAVTA